MEHLGRVDPREVVPIPLEYRRIIHRYFEPTGAAQGAGGQ